MLQLVDVDNVMPMCILMQFEGSNGHVPGVSGADGD